MQVAIKFHWYRKKIFYQLGNEVPDFITYLFANLATGNACIFFLYPCTQQIHLF